MEKTSDDRFCFVLGSGASVQSGIPTGAKLAAKWLGELKENFWTDKHDEWVKEKNISTDKPGEHYSEIFKRRFEIHPQEGYDELNRLMENVTPSFGYSVLSQLLETKNNVVITTNFDALIEEALYSFSIKRPLVCGHEYLAPFAKISNSRPLIVKIHRDRQLNPFNNPGEIERIKEEWVSVLNTIFTQCIPVFIGYGGNDGSLMGYLENIPKFSNLFWCDLKLENLKPEVLELIERHEGKFVKIDGFDELMFDIFSVLSYPTLDSKLVETAHKRATAYANTIKTISESKSKSLIKEDKTNAEELERKIKDTDSWLSYYFKAAAEKDINQKQKILEDGLAKFPEDCGMNECYAMFLYEDRYDYKGAEKYLKKALHINPEDDRAIASYARFLHFIKKDYSNAETYYKKLIGKPITFAGVHANYGTFLVDVKRDYQNAEKHFEIAVSAELENGEIYGTYADFLYKTKSDYSRAAEFYEKAVTRSPDAISCNLNYAGLLLATNKKDQAVKYLKRIRDICFANGEAIKLEKERGMQWKNEMAVELAFYEYAHYPGLFIDAKARIRDLIVRGFRSLTWNLQPNIEQAKKDNHPEPESLQLYADIITKDIPIPPDF